MLTKICNITGDFILVPLARTLPQWISPNFLTWLRFFLIFPIVFSIITEHYFLFIALYLIALFTDGLDGTLARLRRNSTSWGSKIDTFFDKLLQIIVFIFILPNFILEIGLIIFLDLATFIGGYIYLYRNKSLQVKNAYLKPNIAGKYKVFSQGLIIIFYYLWKIFPQYKNFSFIVYFFITITIFLSTISILNYSRVFLLKKTLDNK